ncbi:MAG: FtsW/RodA/SpoVE family cell cycle protein, partial [Patescibacteria group bacterium]
TMFRKYLALLQKSDWLLTVAAIFLVAFGLVASYSIQAANSDSHLLNFKKQIIFFVVGLVVLIVLSVVDYRYLRTFSGVLYAVGSLLLVVALVLGTVIHGTRGWIYFFGTQGFQPVELVKVVMVVAVSTLLARWGGEVGTPRRLLLLTAAAGTLVGLVLLQPDFGSAFILFVIFFGLLLLGRLRRSYLVFITLGLLAVVITSWFLVLRPYQRDRILTFVNPSRDPYGSGYNIKQSIIAVGSGKFFGRGLSLGPQSRLNFLPAQETDFVFAVVAEELGFLGAGLLIGVIVLLVYRLHRVGQQSRDSFGTYLVSGTVIYLAAQSLLNIGMNVGLVPIAGVPLPLVSYGGSSLIASLAMLGIAQSVQIRQTTSRSP